jgi:hypothetical protein
VGKEHIHNAHHAARVAADTPAARAPDAHDRAWSVGRLVPLVEAVVEALAAADEVLTEAKG